MFSDYIIPGILLISCSAGLLRHQDAYDALVTGAGEGLSLLKNILPALVILLSAIGMLRASGALDALALFLAPVFRFFGMPPELLPLMVVRPFSGSAALAVGAELMTEYGVDSRIGRTAAVMLGSTETTFYTISVYFGACGITKTRHTIPAAVLADLTGFFSAALFTRLFFP